MRVGFDALSDAGARWAVCIIGAGAAGLSLAVHLARRRHRVLLCEGGDQTYSERSQRLYRGAIAGDPYIPLDEARLRFFGGSTNHWGGICRPLDPYDFTAKRAAPVTAWPIDGAALAPYRHAAAEILGATPIEPDRELPGSGLKRIHFSLGPPVRLAQQYADVVRHSKHLHYCSTANLFDLETDGGRVTRLRIRDYGGRERSVRARFVVLACGGIENSRLLLWGNRRSAGRLVPQPVTLGRYWMDHPHATLGQGVVFDAARLGLDRDWNVFLAPTRRSLDERGILNCGLRLHRLAAPQTEELIEDLAAVAPALGHRLRGPARERACGVLLRAAWEQEPRADNRIELDTVTDSLGMPRARLVWRKSPLDARTIRRSALMLGDYLRIHDLGRLRLDPWLASEPVQFPTEGELAGRHHMGGTRMGHTPEAGVVDVDCRVFGQANLYIAGSSVFPSGGHANPTLTLVQLALRLADHLQARLRRGG